MIDLTTTQSLLAEAMKKVRALDGVDLDETNSITDQSKGQARQDRARMSQELQHLAHLLDLGADLVRNEYWVARGYEDPLAEPAHQVS